MAKLISVQSASRTAFPEAIDLVLTADLEDGTGNQQHPYTWIKGDLEGIGPQVDAYMAARPSFPIADYVAPPPAPYSIPKDLPWRRMTDAEAVTTEALLAATTPRLRQIYNAANTLNTGDELFETLKAAMVGAFGESRTDELLAAEG